MRERLHPETISARRAKAIDDRRIGVHTADDGMAWLSAFLPVEQAQAIHNRVSDIARGLRGPDDERTLTQLRADVFADLLINGDIAAAVGVGAGIVAKVFVTVPTLTLLGRSDTPGEVEGLVPIAPEVARTLAAHAPSFTRILTHPETGTILSVGRERYKPPTELRDWVSDWVRMRDGTCRTPWNCPHPARTAHLDHAIAWKDGGRTSADNLACLCKGDHTLKHGSAWNVRQIGGGALGEVRGRVLEWTAPSGRTYVTLPQIELPS